MTGKEAARLLQQLVPADKGGSSGIPGGAQRPVPDDTCDLRARIDKLSEDLWLLRRKIEPLQATYDDGKRVLREWIREYQARKTHVGGNEKLNHGSRPQSDDCNNPNQGKI